MSILPKSTPSSVRTGSAALRSSPDTRAAESRPYLVSIQPRRAGAPQQRALPLFPHESEDARLTGSTRSLYRRLLALNLPIEGKRLPVVSEKYSETLTTSAKVKMN